MISKKLLNRHIAVSGAFITFWNLICLILCHELLMCNLQSRRNPVPPPVFNLVFSLISLSSIIGFHHISGKMSAFISVLFTSFLQFVNLNSIFCLTFTIVHFLIAFIRSLILYSIFHFYFKEKRKFPGLDFHPIHRTILQISLVLFFFNGKRTAHGGVGAIKTNKFNRINFLLSLSNSLPQSQ